MKSILVIGIGRFGHHLALKFAELGCEVMVVDDSEDAIRPLLPHVTNAQIGDCKDEEVLRALGVRNFDCCFVCVGDDFQSSLEITSLLKDLGAKRVVSKASREVHAKFLLRNGADEVVYPERDSAERVAVRYSTHRLFDYIELTKEVSIYEIEPIDAWLGKTIRDINFRVRYNASILAIKRGDEVDPLPGPDYVFKADEHLMLVGRHKDMEKILKQLDRKTF